MTNYGRADLLRALISIAALLTLSFPNALAYSTTTFGSDAVGRVDCQLTFERRECMGRQSLG